MRPALHSLLAFSLWTLCVGCAEQHLPTYPFMDASATQTALADRASAIHDVSAQGLLTLTRSDGQSVRLDAALAMAPPDCSRIRAWKFNQAIFDLTVCPRGVFLEGSSDPAHKDQIRAAGASAAKMARTWSLMAGGFFLSPDLVGTIDGKTIHFSKKDAEGVIVCDVNRATLTAERYRLIDPRGQTRFSLELEDYAQFDGSLWPQKITATADSGTVQIELHDVELNGGLPPAAFDPPPRAEKLP
jgi:hypothetical protein